MQIITVFISACQFYVCSYAKVYSISGQIRTWFSYIIVIYGMQLNSVWLNERVCVATQNAA